MNRPAWSFSANVQIPIYKRIQKVKNSKKPKIMQGNPKLKKSVFVSLEGIGKEPKQGGCPPTLWRIYL